MEEGNKKNKDRIQERCFKIQNKNKIMINDQRINERMDDE
jgi:hypothetical protein